MSNAVELIRPDWPAPATVRACASTRSGGVSQQAWQGLNLGLHVDDDPESVEQNRRLLMSAAELPAKPLWLNQVHGAAVAEFPPEVLLPDADASVAVLPGQVCAVMTADCLPVLLCNTTGTKVAAVHAGWRGLEAGVLEQALKCFADDEVLAWLGPAISAASYEVDDSVRDQFLTSRNPAEQNDPNFAAAFEASRPGHWYFDLYKAARIILAANGVAGVYGGDFCTFKDTQFYSYRRDGVTGRQASLIWLEKPSI